MFRSLRQLEGWQQASLIGMAAGTLWVVVFRVPPVLFDDRPLSIPEVLRTLGGLGGIYFLVLWAWGIHFIFPAWRERWREAVSDVDALIWPISTALALLFWLALGGLEVAFEFLPRSIIYLERVPLRAIRALVSRLTPASGRVESQSTDDG